MKLEVIPIPVSDVDCAKAFYSERAGSTVDLDTDIGEGVRLVQLTTPGSGCSIQLNTALRKVPPGGLEGVQLVVADIAAARRAGRARGGRQRGPPHGQRRVGRRARQGLERVRLLQRPRRQRMGRAGASRRRLTPSARSAPAVTKTANPAPACLNARDVSRSLGVPGAGSRVASVRYRSISRTGNDATGIPPKPVTPATPRRDHLITTCRQSTRPSRTSEELPTFFRVRSRSGSERVAATCGRQVSDLT